MEESLKLEVCDKRAVGALHIKSIPASIFQLLALSGTGIRTTRRYRKPEGLGVQIPPESILGNTNKSELIWRSEYSYFVKDTSLEDGGGQQCLTSKSAFTLLHTILNTHQSFKKTDDADKLIGLGTWLVVGCGHCEEWIAIVATLFYMKISIKMYLIDISKEAINNAEKGMLRVCDSFHENERNEFKESFVFKYEDIIQLATADIKEWNIEVVYTSAAVNDHFTLHLAILCYDIGVHCMFCNAAHKKLLVDVGLQVKYGEAGNNLTIRKFCPAELDDQTSKAMAKRDIFIWTVKTLIDGGGVDTVSKYGIYCIIM